jgi:hypothetical protein
MTFKRPVILPKAVIQQGSLLRLLLKSLWGGRANRRVARRLEPAAQIWLGPLNKLSWRR